MKLNKTLLIASILALFIIEINSQIPEAVVKSLQCAQDASSSKFKQNDSVYLCVHYLIETTAQNFEAKRVTFSIDVDKYIAINTKDSFKKFQEAAYLGKNVYLIIQANHSGAATKVAKYITSSGRAYPQLNIVITIDDGKIKDAQFDNGDFTNQSYDSSEKNNYVATTKCNDKDIKCDSQIYVSWLGKDSSGNYMTSGGLRQSRFKKYNGKAFWSTSQKYFS